MQLTRPVVVVALLLLTAGSVRAEPTWSYSWSSTPSVVTSDDGSLGKVTFTPGSGGPITGSLDSGPGAVAAYLDATAPVSGTATFTNRGYGLTLHLTDAASSTSGDLTFSGALTGSLTQGAYDITNAFSGETTKALTLGGNLYTVTAGLFVPPAPGKQGSIAANVTVVPSGTSSPPVTSVPEPGTLLLAAFGVSGLALRTWGRRRPADA